jgi:hypothetical protein
MTSKRVFSLPFNKLGCPSFQQPSMNILWKLIFSKLPSNSNNRINYNIPVIITPQFCIQNGCEVRRTELGSLSNMQIIKFQILSTRAFIPAILKLSTVKKL